MSTEQATVTITLAAKLLAVTRPTIYRMIEMGQIRAIPVATQQRIPMAEIERLLAPMSGDAPVCDTAAEEAN